MLKLHAWPESQAAAHWRDEAEVFLDDAEQRFTPSMRQRVDLDGLYAKALRRVRATTDDSGVPQSLPETCPLTLDELMTGNIAELVIKLAAAA